MSNLEYKSDTFQKSARLLHDSKHYSSVPHCSYYSCLQLMKLICLKHNICSEKDLKVNNSHRFMHEKVTNLLESGHKDNRHIGVKINQLKNIRVRADYLDKPISDSQSQKAISLSLKVVSVLKKYI